MKISITDRSTDIGLFEGIKSDVPSPELLTFMFGCVLILRQLIGPKLASRIELIRVTFFQPRMCHECQPTFHVIWHSVGGEKNEETFDEAPYARPNNRNCKTFDREAYAQCLADELLKHVRSKARRTITEAGALRRMAIKEVGTAA